MTDADLLDAIAPAKAGDTAARNAVVEHALPTLRSVAVKMAERTRFRIESEEFISVGVLAINGIIRGFDPARGIKFSAYATHRFRGAMLDYLREIDLTSRNNRQRTAQRDDFANDYYARHGQRPTPAETQTAIGLTDVQFAALQYPDPYRPASFSTALFDPEGGRQLCVADHAADPDSEQGVNAADARDLIRHVLDTRGLRMALMLRLYYIDEWTMKEIGTAFTSLGTRDSKERPGRPTNRIALSETSISQAMSRLLKDLREEFAEAA